MSHETTLSRRGFIGAAGAAAAGVALAGAFAGTAQAEDDPFLADSFEGETDPIPPVDPPAAWDAEADIVVIGAGGGMSGALRALDLGASCIVLEKMPIAGGETSDACVLAFFTDNQCQRDEGYPDCTEQLRATFLSSVPFGEQYVTFTDDLLAASKEFISWTEDLGFEWEPGYCVGSEAMYAVAPKGTEEGLMNARNMSYYTSWLVEQIEARGGEIMYSTPATALVMEDGAVVGVQASDEKDNTIYVKANKGVLISANGISDNQAMLAKYCPDALRCKFSSSGNYAQGDGIRMGFGAGAEFSGYNQYGIFDGGLNNVPWEYYLYNPAVQLVRQPWLGIDVFGARYPYDTTALSGFTSQGKRLRDLPGNQGYVFFDDNYEERVPTFNQLMCRIPLSDAMPDIVRMPESLRDWTVGAKEAIEDGVIESADTIEELAEKLGLDPDVVTKAVDDWNERCAAGADPDGPYEDHPEWLYPIDTPPYHGAAIGGFIYATSAGLEVNEHLQVLAKDGNPIPHLYATGASAARMMQVLGSCGFANCSAYVAVNHALS